MIAAPGPSASARVPRWLGRAAVPLAVCIAGCGSSGEDASDGGATADAGGGDAPVTLADGATVPATSVRFFVDVNSKAPQPGDTIRFTYVLWNGGAAPAYAVDLPVHLDVTQLGYVSLTGMLYVPGSLGIDRTYDPNTSKESYYFVPLAPLTDADDGDEAAYDDAQRIVHLHLPELGPGEHRVFAWQAKVDPVFDCTLDQLLQAYAEIHADNAPVYTNDIAGAIVCTSPTLRVDVASDRASQSPGGPITYTLTYAYSPFSFPGSRPGRFDIARVRITHEFPAALLDVGTVSDGGEAGSGRVDWEIANLATGGSGTVTWTANVHAGVGSGTAITTSATVLSQNTIARQDVAGPPSTVTVSP
jgi:hypothetical protein